MNFKKKSIEIHQKRCGTETKTRGVLTLQYCKIQLLPNLQMIRKPSTGKP